MFSWVEYSPNPLENMLIWDKNSIEVKNYTNISFKYIIIV